MKRFDLALLSVAAVVCGIRRAGAGQVSLEAGQGRSCRSAPAARPTSSSASSASRCARASASSFVVENKPGAFGILAIEEMARRSPTATRCRSATSRHQRAHAGHLQDKFKIDYDKDVVMVTRLGELPLDPRRHHQELRAEDLRRVHRLRQGEPRQGALRQRRRRQQQPLRHGGLRAVGRHQAACTSRTRAAAPRIINDLVRGDVQVALVNAASSAGVIKAGMLRAGGDGRRAAAGISGRADAQGAGLSGRQGPVVGAATRPPDAAEVLETLHKAIVQALSAAPVQEAFKKQMIKAVPERLARGGASLDARRDRVLEEDHRAK